MDRRDLVFKTVENAMIIDADIQQILGSKPQAIRSLEMMLDELLAEAARRPGWPWSLGDGISKMI